jgi:hypothetical protein
MTRPTIPFKPHALRCPTCNQYLPDRCTCNGMSIEQARQTTITLFADNLYSKWGFHDGDILNDAWYALGLSGDRHEVLCQLVEERLLPILPHPVKTERISTCHNPIRVEDEHLEDNSRLSNENTSVDITYQDIRECAVRLSGAIDIEFSSAGLRELAATLVGRTPPVPNLQQRKTIHLLKYAPRDVLNSRAAMIAPNLQQLPKWPPNEELRIEQERLRAFMVGMDFADLEDRLVLIDYSPGLPTVVCSVPRRKIIQHYDSPAGHLAGRVEVWDGDKHIVTISLSGNARQRRRTIRQLKREFTVRQTNAATGETIIR